LPVSDTELLLRWYRRHRRILPWREDPTPYHVWLSEIMLQQTRVEAVIGYYRRFLHSLPDIAALAAAPEDQVLKLWEGLGYYSRARNLHRAAGQIMEECGGVMPQTAAELRQLAGIGPYTAAAIASIAFGERIPALDGNLLRVYARRTDCRENIRSRAAAKAAAEFYRAAMPQQRPGDYNQALMDLGAAVCLPGGQPLCERCPWQHCCAAHKAGTEAELPVLPAKKKRRVEKRTVLLLSDGSRFALRRRPPQGLLAGLWEFPSLEGSVSRRRAAAQIRAWGMEPVSLQPTEPAVHIFTHREWHMTGYLAHVKALRECDGLIAATREEIAARYSIPSAFRAFLKYVGTDLRIVEAEA
jgi:A/G-specific adenine glycosylase